MVAAFESPVGCPTDHLYGNGTVRLTLSMTFLEFSIAVPRVALLVTLITADALATEGCSVRPLIYFTPVSPDPGPARVRTRDKHLPLTAKRALIQRDGEITYVACLGILRGASSRPRQHIVPTAGGRC